MPEATGSPSRAVAFLQSFVSEIAKAMDRAECPSCAAHLEQIEQIGLTAGVCLEEKAREVLGSPRPMDRDHYADLIVEIKNQIGGRFSRASGEAGTVRVVNSRCPFGEQVKHAPSLCRMTSSVFGGIAARHFGYAKVELRQTIAGGDGSCDVCIYLDPQLAARNEGTEYRADGERLTSGNLTTFMTPKVHRRLRENWCPPPVGAGSPDAALQPIVAESAAMRDALRAVRIVAPTDVTVMITGETGCGKELVARALHGLSARRDKPMVTVNCGAIPENLVETALFGHEKGAFTGAYEVHHGYFERAEKGTLFLDEIDSLPLSAQAKLLRVIQEGEYERVGGKRSLRSDVRIIAASNREIVAMVDAGHFRRDLFYRLNVVPIAIPPLRERTEDIDALITHILRKLAQRYATSEKTLVQAARLKALAYAWPGNIREMENVLERAFIFAADARITDIDVPVTAPTESVPAWRTRKQQAAKQAEVDTLTRALRVSHGNVDQIATQMGITPRAVRMKLKAQGLRAADYR
ncbi:sigma 54-interacting transcriptional regulator [Thiocapsa marina]|uniref:Sigma54 specific transcriptional regulator, Fis family n=1 Tax=Thiocapsa marina 5811 TaxID=768671 RepID=F9UDC1_9GAMM|nr:sigma 54-interacting transcriptional regulator [Thiocapsa marina]EGV17865.1 sigma54 specific transcriptional regulator, Fis family [Thiocapsa marina 5811]